MRKDEWFLQFERRLHTLPTAEKQRAIDYYKELYSDKYEAGMSENDILLSFGSPEEAAREIIENYAQENGKEKRGANDFNETFGEKTYENKTYPNDTYAYAPPPKKASNSGREIAATLASVALALFLGYWAVVATAVLGGIEIVLLVAGIVLSVLGLQTLGVGLILFGLFAVLLYPCCLAIVWMFKGIVFVVKKLYNDISGRS